MKLITLFQLISRAINPTDSLFIILFFFDEKRRVQTSCESKIAEFYIFSLKMSLRKENFTAINDLSNLYFHARCVYGF